MNVESRARGNVRRSEIRNADFDGRWTTMAKMNSRATREPIERAGRKGFSSRVGLSFLLKSLPSRRSAKFDRARIYTRMAKMSAHQFHALSSARNTRAQDGHWTVNAREQKKKKEEEKNGHPRARIISGRAVR